MAAIMTQELLPASMSIRTPTVVVNDPYYPDNEYSKVKEFELKAQILTLTQMLEPWEAEAARRTAYGETMAAISKVTKKQHKLVNACLNMQSVQDLIALWQAVIVYQQGPNELQRKNMLWRIAVDNEDKDPKGCIKAIAEMNRMEDNKRGVSHNRIEIVINGETMPSTDLDG